MKTKQRRYSSHVQFVAITVNVTAKNKVDAVKKIKKKVASMDASRMIDRQNFFVEHE